MYQMSQLAKMTMIARERMQDVTPMEHRTASHLYLELNRNRPR